MNERRSCFYSSFCLTESRKCSTHYRNCAVRHRHWTDRRESQNQISIVTVGMLTAKLYSHEKLLFIWLLLDCILFVFLVLFNGQFVYVLCPSDLLKLFFWRCDYFYKFLFSYFYKYGPGLNSRIVTLEKKITLTDLKRSSSEAVELLRLLLSSAGLLTFVRWSGRDLIEFDRDLVFLLLLLRGILFTSRLLVSVHSEDPTLPVSSKIISSIWI